MQAQGLLRVSRGRDEAALPLRGEQLLDTHLPTELHSTALLQSHPAYAHKYQFPRVTG